MGIAERLELYGRVEDIRKKPLIVYVTSARPNATGLIAQDAISELLNQLQRLPRDADDLDLLVVSNGGDGTVAWRFVSLIRERVKKFSILVPQAAFSAATLIALGANEIVMHPHGNLGPTDPQISNPQKGVQFGYEDVQAYLRFAKEKVGLSEEGLLCSLFLRFSEEVGFVHAGVAARSALLSMSMGENMLRLHLTDAEGKPDARTISETLNTKFFHHGYPLNRTEAHDIGLPVANPDQALEDLMWSIWTDLEEELQLREPFIPLRIVRENHLCQSLFAPVPQMPIPPGSPPQAIQMLAQLFFQQFGQTAVPPTPFEYSTALMESGRHASRARVTGHIFAARQHDMDMKITLQPEKMGWTDVALPLPAPASTPAGAEPQAAVPPEPAPAPTPSPPAAS